MIGLCSNLIITKRLMAGYCVLIHLSSAHYSMYLHACTCLCGWEGSSLPSCGQRRTMQPAHVTTPSRFSMSLRYNSVSSQRKIPVWRFVEQMEKEGQRLCLSVALIFSRALSLSNADKTISIKHPTMLYKHIYSGVILRHLIEPHRRI